MSDIWNPQFTRTSHRFEAIVSLGLKLETFENWPTLEDCNRFLLKFGVTNVNANLLRCVPQAPRKARRWRLKSTILTKPYEMHVLEEGVIPTRLKNWHDFCNLLTWCRFPKTKATLNRMQARPQGVLRNRYQELLTLFDEGGVVRIYPHISSPPGTYPSDEPIKNIYFGHALLEADLCQFKNSNGFTLPLYLEPSLLHSLLAENQLYPWVDQEASRWIGDGLLTKLTRHQKDQSSERSLSSQGTL